MRTRIIFVVIILGMVACTNPTQTSLSQDEKAMIAGEVELALNSIIEGWQNLDVDKAFKDSFSDTPDFVYIGIDGALMKYSDFYNTAKDVFEYYEKAELNINKKIIRVVSGEVAIVSVYYSGAFYSEESKLAFPGCGGTLVFNKLDGRWKVIHFHESIQESNFIETPIG